MDDDSLSLQLRNLLSEIDSSKESIERGYERFRIALTGALRLLDEDNPMLEKLHGSPEELKGFVLRLATELGKETMSHWNSIRPQIEQIIASINEPHNRKS